jgi:hypothetical protein
VTALSRLMRASSIDVRAQTLNISKRYQLPVVASDANSGVQLIVGQRSAA